MVDLSSNPLLFQCGNVFLCVFALLRAALPELLPCYGVRIVFLVFLECRIVQVERTDSDLVRHAFLDNGDDGVIVAHTERQIALLEVAGDLGWLHFLDVHHKELS